jgi:hypothetical protein
VYVERHASWVLVEKEREGTSLDYELVGRHGLRLSGAQILESELGGGESGYTAAVTTASASI